MWQRQPPLPIGLTPDCHGYVTFIDRILKVICAIRPFMVEDQCLACRVECFRTVSCVGVHQLLHCCGHLVGCFGRNGVPQAKATRWWYLYETWLDVCESGAITIVASSKYMISCFIVACIDVCQVGSFLIGSRKLNLISTLTHPVRKLQYNSTKSYDYYRKDIYWVCSQLHWLEDGR